MPGRDDAGVAAGGLEPDALLLLDERDLVPRLGQEVGRGHADDTATEDEGLHADRHETAPQTRCQGKRWEAVAVGDILAAGRRPMDALDFFLIRYHEFHRTFADDLMAGLSPAQVRGRPQPGVNPIAWS